MTKLELRDGFNTILPKEEVSAKIMQYLKINEIKIKESDQNHIMGLYGSQMKAHMRGILADPSILPVKVFIYFDHKENCTEISVTLKEGFKGIPPLGIKKKYPIIFGRLMNRLKLAFLPQEPADVGKDLCPSCHNPLVDANQKFCEACGFEVSKVIF